MVISEENCDNKPGGGRRPKQALPLCPGCSWKEELMKLEEVAFGGGGRGPLPPGGGGGFARTH